MQDSREVGTPIPGTTGDAKFGSRWSFVASWAGATATGRKRRSISGQAEERDPKEPDARRSSAGEVTGSGSTANASTASVEDKTARRNLRVTSPAWLERRHSKERGNFVPASRVGTKEPGENGSRNESLAGGAEAGGERKQRQRLRSKARQPQEDSGSAESLAAGVTPN